jgi:hypothetical protein
MSITSGDDFIEIFFPPTPKLEGINASFGHPSDRFGFVNAGENSVNANR